jgi:hypothetical protein
VLTLKFTGDEWVTVGLAVGGEEPDGVGVGLDGLRALVLGLQGAPKAPVEDQEVTRGSWRLAPDGWVDDMVPLVRVW